jgi:hypothetical protein
LATNKKTKMGEFPWYSTIYENSVLSDVLTKEHLNAVIAVVYEIQQKYNLNFDLNLTIYDLRVLTKDIYDDLTFDLTLILDRNQQFVDKWKNKPGQIKSCVISTHPLKKYRLFWRLVDPIKNGKLKAKLKRGIVVVKNKIWNR